MGFSFRKSFGAGPFRINLSKSGVSYSFGVKGARVNVGPRGTYVNLSSHGISYRKRISSSYSPEPSVPQRHSSDNQEVHHIASSDIGQLTDSDSKEFISELSEKAGKISFMLWFGVIPLILFFIYLIASSRGTPAATESKADSIVVRVTSPVGVYVRKSRSSKSDVLRTAAEGQTFQLLDSTDQRWFEVRFSDTIGYIGKRYATIDHVDYEELVQEIASHKNPYVGYQLGAGLVFFSVLIVRLRKIDRKRFQMELHYEMDDQFKHVYQQFTDHFSTFSGSQRVWQYLTTHRTSDYKRNAGAGKLINRVAVKGLANNKMPLPFFKTNVPIPYLKLSNLEFYFLPERLLVRQGSTFGAIFYKNLKISSCSTRFIEEESLPGDATVVDRTWKFVNKRGGPDLRFNNNRQLPVCAYSEYTFTSESGIYEVITTSKQGAMDPFATFLTRIGELQGRMTIE